MHGHGTNSHSLKILPASDGAPRISAEIPAKQLIPIDQRGRGTPSDGVRKSRIETVLRPAPKWWSANLFPTENPEASSVFEQRGGRMESRTEYPGARETNLELAFFAENRVESRGRGARVHASKVKKHHGFVGGMADMTLVISGERG
jgi:hypothetical protein